MNSNATRRALLTGIAGAALIPAWGTRAQNGQDLVVTKDPSCGCCAAWIDHMRVAGFTVTVREAPVNPLKMKLGVPRDLASCHTAQIGNYVVEGHVPAGAVKKLLAQKPDAVGIAVPGMPVGSPGMEIDGSEPETYEVIQFGPADRRVFARYRGGTPIET